MPRGEGHARPRRPLRAALLAAAAIAWAGCLVEEEVGWSTHPLAAHCEAEVRGTGTLDVEHDYLPQVVACENGGASLEALKAQAIAARTYLYYKLGREGAIGDGQGDQVYSCANEAGDVHRQAVAETSGEILMYQDVVIAAFYVAGARQTGPSCRGGTDDPTNTERYVTYNEGRSGDDIEQTTLGWVSPTNHENRGCQSQNGADCLSDAGWDDDSIIRFYYGADIDVVRAEGPCVTGGDDGDGDGPGDDGTGEEGELSGGCSAGGQGAGGGGWLAVLAVVVLGGLGGRGRGVSLLLR